MKALCSLALLGAVFCAHAASATAPAQTGLPTLIVNFADLNMHRIEGVQVAYRRIHIAAERVCGEVPARDLARYHLYQDCRNQAIGRAVDEIDNPLLTQYAIQRPSRVAKN